MTPQQKRVVLVVLAVAVVCAVISAILGGWITASSAAALAIAQVLTLRHYRRNPAQR